jgi:hypothetical protein
MKKKKTEREKQTVSSPSPFLSTWPLPITTGKGWNEGQRTG